MSVFLLLCLLQIGANFRWLAMWFFSRIPDGQCDSIGLLPNFVDCNPLMQSGHWISMQPPFFPQSHKQTYLLCMFTLCIIHLPVSVWNTYMYGLNAISLMGTMFTPILSCLAIPCQPMPFYLSVFMCLHLLFTMNTCVYGFTMPTNLCWCRDEVFFCFLLT